MGVSRRHTLSMHLFLTLALATSLTLATPDPTVHVPLTYSQYPIAQYAQYPMAQYPSVRTMYHDCDDSLHDCEDTVAVLPHGVRYVVPKNVAPYVVPKAVAIHHPTTGYTMTHPSNLGLCVNYLGQRVTC